MSGTADARRELARMAREARCLVEKTRASRWDGIEDLEAPAATPALAAPAAKAGASRSPSKPPASRTRSTAPAGPRAPEPIPPGLHTLEKIAAAVAACTKCPLHATRTRTVPGEGNAHARLMFVGEAPGADEDRQGRPFVGRAGQLLTDMIVKGMGLAREDVFIANVLKCRPPGNRDPQPEEAAACLPYLRAQLALVRPEAICALGRHAAHALLDTKQPIGRLRGRWQEYEGVPLMPTFHPSYLLRSPGDKKTAWEDLKLVLARLGLPVPGARPAEGR